MIVDQSTSTIVIITLCIAIAVALYLFVVLWSKLNKITNTIKPVSQNSTKDDIDEDFDENIESPLIQNQLDIELQSIVDGFIENSTTLVRCPCGQEFPAIVTMNGENLFECRKCNSKFRIELIQEPILVTEPLNLEQAYNTLIEAANKKKEIEEKELD